MDGFTSNPFDDTTSTKKKTQNKNIMFSNVYTSLDSKNILCRN
jgi:hypothetical protein